jgi:hypothetical protein
MAVNMCIWSSLEVGSAEGTLKKKESFVVADVVGVFGRLQNYLALKRGRAMGRIS